MRPVLLLFLACSLIGCASPAADYIRADDATWRVYDAPLVPGGPAAIDEWIDREPSYSPDKRDALHQLNTARRARIAHAVASVGSQ